MKYVILIGYQTIADEADEVAKCSTNRSDGYFSSVFGRAQEGLVPRSAARGPEVVTVGSKEKWEQKRSEIKFSNQATRPSWMQASLETSLRSSLNH